MTNEKRNHAIEWITRELGFLRRAPALNGCEMKKEWAEQIEVFEAALEALKDHVREDTKMVPLTLDQLQQITPERVLLVQVLTIDEETGQPDPDSAEWEMWDGHHFASANTWDDASHYGEKFLAYACQPSQINLETYRTCELVQELRRREGVEAHIAEPYQDLTVTAPGPAVVLIVID